MRVHSSVAILLCAFFHGFSCQVHYVPAQVLIPTINGTHLAANHSIYNPAPVYHPPQAVNNNNYNPNNNYYYQPNNSYNGSRDGHLFLGSIRTYDRLLFNQIYFKPGQWWRSREKVIEYPKDLPAGYSRHETISAIRITNQFYDGNTARASVDRGGIGSQYVKITLRSNWGKGFKYLVQFFGQ